MVTSKFRIKGRYNEENRIADRSERRKEFPSIWERWRVLPLDFQFHARLWSDIGDVRAHEFHSYLEYERDILDVPSRMNGRDLAVGGAEYSDRYSLFGSDDGMEFSVLVDSPVFAEQRQGCDHRIVRVARNRLSVTYGVDVPLAHSRQSSRDVGVEIVHAVVDRKLNEPVLVGFRNASLLNEQPSEMVKCGSCIIEHVPYQQSPFPWKLPNAAYRESNFASVFVELLPHREVWFRVRVWIPDYVRFELLEMHLRPAKLGKGVRKVANTHGLPLEGYGRQAKGSAHSENGKGPLHSGANTR